MDSRIANQLQSGLSLSRMGRGWESPYRRLTVSVVNDAEVLAPKLCSLIALADDLCSQNLDASLMAIGSILRWTAISTSFRLWVPIDSVVNKCHCRGAYTESYSAKSLLQRPVE